MSQQHMKCRVSELGARHRQRLVTASLDGMDRTTVDFSGQT